MLLAMKVASLVLKHGTLARLVEKTSGLIYERLDARILVL